MCYSFVLLGNYTLNVKRTSNSQTFLARLTLILRAQLTFQLSLWRKQKKKPKHLTHTNSHSHACVYVFQSISGALFAVSAEFVAYPANSADSALDINHFGTARARAGVARALGALV